MGIAVLIPLMLASVRARRLHTSSVYLWSVKAQKAAVETSAYERAAVSSCPSDICIRLMRLNGKRAAPLLREGC